MECAAIGGLAARFAAAERRGETLEPPPPTTAHGALLAHITGGHVETIDAGPSSFQPMNVNFGLFPPVTEPLEIDPAERKQARPRQGQGRRAQDRAQPPGARRFRALDWRCAAGGRGGVAVSSGKSASDCARRATATIAA